MSEYPQEPQRTSLSANLPLKKQLINGNCLPTFCSIKLYSSIRAIDAAMRIWSDNLQLPIQRDRRGQDGKDGHHGHHGHHGRQGHHGHKGHNG